MYLRTCAPSENSDQFAYSHSLIRLFTRLVLNTQGRRVASSSQKDSSQADLNLRWARMVEGTFSHVAAQVMNIIIKLLNSAQK